tara:strand:+ start:1830 stop:2729 length:900 start_codon:yes stop_codon:yes gene_type:complete
MDKKDFNKYKTSFNQYQFKDIVLEEFIGDIKNPYYYDYFIDNWYTQRLLELNKNQALKERVELLRDFLLNLRFLMSLIIELYEVIERCDSIDSGRINRVRIKNNEVLTMLETIEEIKISVQLNDEKGKNDLAIIIRNYCLHKLEEVKILFRNYLQINIEKSPLKKEFTCLIKSIKKSASNFYKSELRDKRKIPLDYLKITTLFAQGLIHSEKSKTKTGKKIFFNEIEFNSILELRKHLEENTLKDVNFRQYLEDTLNESEGKKDLYYNKAIYSKTYDYCLNNNIKMTDYFKSKYDKFNN